jgi:hypothetical protein
MKKYKIRVLQDENHFYPQCKIDSYFQSFFTEDGYKVYFNTIQNSLDYMSDRLFSKNKKQRKIVYTGEIK